MGIKYILFTADNSLVAKRFEKILKISEQKTEPVFTIMENVL